MRKNSSLLLSSYSYWIYISRLLNAHSPSLVRHSARSGNTTKAHARAWAIDSLFGMRMARMEKWWWAFTHLGYYNTNLKVLRGDR